MNTRHHELVKPVWVSLGGGCDVAYQLRRLGLSEYNTPFDWVRVPEDEVPRLLDGGMTDVVSRLRVARSTSGKVYLRDPISGAVLLHDGPTASVADRARLAEKFAAQHDALVRVLRSGGPVRLVRGRLPASRAAGFLSSLRKTALLRGVEFKLIAVARRVGSPVSLIAMGSDMAAYEIPTAEDGAWWGSYDAWDELVRLESAGAATAGRWAAPWGSRDLAWIRTRVDQELAEHAETMRRIPQTLVDALRAAEDHRHRFHLGVDPISTARAVVFQGKRGGGSTIEQQLFRTILGRRERSVRRKVRELVGATLLAATLSKDSSARLYLSVAYFGARMNGVRQACESLGFDLPTLDRAQAASVVARLKFPEPNAPTAARVRLIGRRARHIERRMEAGRC